MKLKMKIAILALGLCIPGHAYLGGYVWADDSSAASYRPDTVYSYNPAGGSILATRIGTGRYAITLRDFGGKGRGIGNVQVSAYQTTKHCKVVSWNSADDDFSTNVTCFDPSGNAADSRFMVWMGWPDYGMGYGLALSEAATSYDLGSFGYNFSGAAVHVTREDVGQYAVFFPRIGGSGLGSNVQVTAYGDGNAYCNVSNWIDSAGGTVARANCFGADGSAADSKFSIRLGWQAGLGAYAYTGSVGTAVRLPAAPYSINPYGSIATVRNSAGNYRVTFAGVSAVVRGGGTALVTAYGANKGHCVIDSWSSAGVDVICLDAGGVPEDRLFALWVGGKRPDLAYAWADDSASASYTPNPNFSYNRAQAPIAIRRSGTGIYEVVFAGMGRRSSDSVRQFGNVQVTAHGAGSKHCKVVDWAFGSFVDTASALRVEVRCYDAGGDPTDARFSAKLAWPAVRSGYTMATALSLSRYTPFALESFNASGDSIIISRGSVGHYDVEFRGLGKLPADLSPSTVLVTAAGDGATFCRPVSWITTTHFAVKVWCEDKAGFADSWFSIWAGWPSRNAAFALGEQAEATTPYSADSNYAYNPQGPVRVTRVGAGSYAVVFQGLLRGQGNVQVTSVGTEKPRCKAVGWGASSAGFTVNVACHDPTGAPMDSKFNVWAGWGDDYVPPTILRSAHGLRPASGRPGATLYAPGLTRFRSGRMVTIDGRTLKIESAIRP